MKEPATGEIGTCRGKRGGNIAYMMLGTGTLFNDLQSEFDSAPGHHQFSSPISSHCGRVPGRRKPPRVKADHRAPGSDRIAQNGQWLLTRDAIMLAPRGQLLTPSHE